MRKLAVMLLLSAIFLPAFSSTGSAQDVSAERLRGGNENPPVISEGSGRFTAESEDDRITFRLTYDVASGDSDALQAHLHIGNPGNNGGIVVFLCSNLGNTPPDATERDCPESPGEVTGDIVAEDVQEVSEGDPAVLIIEAGDLEGLKRLIDQGSVYANVHTDDHMSGEVRGQTSPRRR